MLLISVSIALAEAGLAVWLINRFVPMRSTVRVFVNGTIAVLATFQMLQTPGVWASIVGVLPGIFPGAR